MKYKVILRILGTCLMGFSCLMLLPLVCSIYYQESDFKIFIISILMTSLIGFIFYRQDKSNNIEISLKEGFFTVFAIWLSMSIFGSLPYLLSSNTITNAFFESVSGLTATGATIFSDVESLSKGIILWRSTTHWLGGMGIVVLSLAILPVLGIGGMELFRAEASSVFDENKLTPRIKDTAKILWQVYLLMTLSLLMLLLFFGMGFFDAINHTMSIVSSGGFSSRNNSIAHFNNSYIHWTVIIFMFLASINYFLHWHFLSGNFKRLFLDYETRVYIGLQLVAISLIVAILIFNNSYQDILTCIKEVSFVITSTFSSTGLIITDYGKWPLACQFIIFTSLFCGGCAGSTAGGIKVIRHIIVYKFAYQQVYLLLHPRAITKVHIGSQIIHTNIFLGVIAFIILWLLFFITGAFLLSLGGLNFLSALSSSASCLANVGTALGDLGPSYDYSTLNTFNKWVLTFLMLFGRLEILTVIILFTPAFYKD